MELLWNTLKDFLGFEGAVLVGLACLSGAILLLVRNCLIMLVRRLGLEEDLL